MALQANTRKIIATGVRYFDRFTRGNVKGRHRRHLSRDDTGRLPEPWLTEWRRGWSAGLAAEVSQPAIAYAIYSWDTPIAWAVRVYGGRNTVAVEWTVPTVRYSQSTLNHQNAVITAIDDMIRERPEWSRNTDT